MHKAFAAVFAVFLSFSTYVHAQTVTVSGECVGVKVYTDGLIITDTTELTDTNGKSINIAAKYGIKKGDIIKKVNGTDAVSTSVLSEAVKNGEQITLSILHNSDIYDVTITPVTTKDGAKLGLWLRDSTAGLGTITCSIGDRFIALGHGICDIDTGDIMPVKHGIIQKCSKTGITKGKPGMPGAITGSINGTKLGEISSNTEYGLSGTVQSPIEGTDLATADSREIRLGNASILADVDGEGIKEYSIKIKQLSPCSSAGKDMIIEITDKELIKKTGGIIQGMSGSPIIQNNKLIGAITHVFVNNPTRGYGIFIENMLENTKYLIL